MTCQGSRLGGDPFHQVSVAADCVRIVVNYIIVLFIISSAQLSFSHCHTYSHTDTLSQRTSGSINTCGVAELRMAWSQAAPLAELLQFFHRQIVAAQVQQAVQQHGAMSGGQYKTVTVNPSRMIRVVIHSFGK
ncbi:hypothetical protein D3C75_904070 [compost metagenome]